MSRLVPQKRRDKNGVVRTVYVRPGGQPPRSGSKLPAPLTPALADSSLGGTKPVDKAEFELIRQAIVPRMRGLDWRLQERGMVKQFEQSLARLGRHAPEALRFFADRFAVCDDYEARLLKGDFLRAEVSGAKGDDRAFAESFARDAFVSSVLATLNPDEGKRLTEHAAELRYLLEASTRECQRPVTDRSIKALLLANWASRSDENTGPLDPAAHDRDLQFIEEHIDSLLARRDFIAARRPSAGSGLEETMQVLRLAISDGASALLEAAL